MGRSRNPQKARAEAEENNPSSSAVTPVPKTLQTQRFRLKQLLPRLGFQWQMVGNSKSLPNLHQDFVFRLEDAYFDYYSSHRMCETFAGAIGFVIATAVDLFDGVVGGDDDDDDDDDDYDDPMEIEPVELWSRVQALCDEGSFARHPRITFETIHAFVAYAIEAREYYLQYVKPSQQEYVKRGDLALVVDMIINRFETGDSSRKDEYFYPAESARWVLKTSAGATDENGEEEIGGQQGLEDNGRDGAIDICEVNDVEDVDHLEETEDVDHLEEAEDVEDCGEAIEGVEMTSTSMTVVLNVVFRPRV